MSTFESIQIEGFRRLANVKLALRPLMVMIGANGCGKTSFLDTWRLLAKSAEGKLAETISSLGGIAEVLTRRRQSSAETTSISFEVHFKQASEVHIKKQPFKKQLDVLLRPHEYMYGLTLKRSGLGYEIQDERTSDKSFDDSAATNQRVFGEATETVLSALRSKHANLIRQRLSPVYYARPFDLAIVRRPQSVQPARVPGEQGESLVSCLYSLRETDRDRFEVVEDTLRTAFPDFERLEFPPVAAGMLAIAWKDRQFTQPIYTNQFSEGTLRFLWLTALLLSRDLPAVTLIDEPEVSLHPELLSLLVDLMREASQRTQLIVATHSDRLIRFLKPEEVMVCDLEEGVAKFSWGDSLDLDHWLKEYTLDQVWQMGVMGGRAS